MRSQFRPPAHSRWPFKTATFRPNFSCDSRLVKTRTVTYACCLKCWYIYWNNKKIIVLSLSLHRIASRRSRSGKMSFTIGLRQQVEDSPGRETGLRAGPNPTLAHPNGRADSCGIWAFSSERFYATSRWDREQMKLWARQNNCRVR